MKKTWQGLALEIEVPKGGIRSGKSDDGKRWSVAMPCAYGHVIGTEGDDEEEVDVFLGDDLSSPNVFAINQLDPESGEHDEQKIMLGFNSEDEAARAYVASFSDGKGKDRLGKMMRLSVEAFKDQIKDLRTAKAYAAGGRVGYDRGGLVVVQSPSGAKFQVASAYAPKFQALLEDLEGTGYSINPKTSGGYNYRNIKGTNTLSNHAHGAAIDINWDRNARGSRGEIDAELARSLAAKHGLRWGGDYKNPDPMHFEVVNPDPLPVSARGITAYAGHRPNPSPDPIDDVDVAEKPYTPLPKGWGEGVGNEILKAVASEDSPRYPRAPTPPNLRMVKPDLSVIPFEASIKEWGAMPYTPRKEGRADGGVAELRSYEPTLGDRFNQALDAVGGVFGYEDLPERTSELYDLIEIPANLAIAAAPLSRTLSILNAGEKGRDASLADSLMRYGAKERTVAPGRVLSDRGSRQAFQKENLRLGDDPSQQFTVYAPETLGEVKPGWVNNVIGPESRFIGVRPANSQTPSKPNLSSIPGGRKADGGPVRALPGTQGGEVEESPEMRFSRGAQKALGYTAGLMGGIAGTHLGGLPGNIVGVMPGIYLIDNADEPNIRDVLADKARQKLKPYRPGHADGGIVTGPLRSPHMGAGGRTDTLPISVPSGAFVFPADTVSALGENNTEHGFRVLEEMFAESRANRGNVTGQEKNAEGDYESSANHVPIIAAEGEYVVPPESVAWVGGGDLDRGHKILEKLVLRIRSKHIDDLKKLPRPHR